MSVHRAAVVGGAVLLAALTVSGSSAAPVESLVLPPAAVSAAAPALAAPVVSIASTATLVPAGSAFHVDIGYTCSLQSQTNIYLEAHQDVGHGFVANGYGSGRGAPTCDGRSHTMRVTVVPNGERGFTSRPAFVLADVTSCTADGRTCSGASAERSLTIR